MGTIISHFGLCGYFVRLNPPDRLLRKAHEESLSHPFTFTEYAMTHHPFRRWTPVLAVLLLALSGCASGPQLPPPPTPSEIVQLSKGNTPPKDIIARMQASQAVYEISASDFVRLGQEGVSSEVLNYMQATQIDQLRRDVQRQRYYFDDPFFYSGFRRSYAWRYYSPYRRF